MRTQCVPATQPHRTIVVGQDHDILQNRRREQLTPEFHQRMHQRSAIEATISELIRAHGLRRSRYRGFAKVELQNLFIGAACNIKRWLRAVVTLQTLSESVLKAVLSLHNAFRTVFLAVAVHLATKTRLQLLTT